MSTYTCENMRPVRDGDDPNDFLGPVDSMDSAARVFAGRIARKMYGRRGQVRALRRDGWTEDGRVVHYEAFLGKPARESGGTVGANERFIVRCQ